MTTSDAATGFRHAREVEVQTERDEALALFPNAYSGIVLRVRCRFAGTRRWRSFLLVPDEGEGYHELEAKAPAVAEAVLHGG